MKTLQESLNSVLDSSGKSVTKWYTQANSQKIPGVGWFTSDGNIKVADSDSCVFIYEFANSQTHRNILDKVHTHFTTSQNLTIMGAIVFNLEETKHTIDRDLALVTKFQNRPYSKADLLHELAASGGWGPVEVHGQQFLGTITLTAEVLHRRHPKNIVDIVCSF